MRTNGAALAALAFFASIAFSAACGSPDQHPYGGAHGGSVAAAPSPSEGSSDSGASVSSPDAGPAVGTPPPVACTPGPAPTTAPTFTQLYTNDFAPGAKIDCATGSGCHTEFQTKDGGWNYLSTWNQVGSTPVGLVTPKVSCLSWYGGTMPKSGTPCYSDVMADIAAWAAAGGQNN